MPKKKRSKLAPIPLPAPVVHGDCFRTFLYEAQSIGNEVSARREFDSDVVEYLKSKGLFEDWSAWRESKRPSKI